MEELRDRQSRCAVLTVKGRAAERCGGQTGGNEAGALLLGLVPCIDYSHDILELQFLFPGLCARETQSVAPCHSVWFTGWMLPGFHRAGSCFTFPRSDFRVILVVIILSMFCDSGLPQPHWRLTMITYGWVPSSLWLLFLSCCYIIVKLLFHFAPLY